MQTKIKKKEFQELGRPFRIDFDDNFNSIYNLFEILNPHFNQTLKLGFTLCIGSLIDKYHTIIVEGSNLMNRTETINNILFPISPSLICSLYGNSKKELLKISPEHRILRIVNFKKCIELITLLTKINQEESIVYKDIKIQKLTIITDACNEEIPAVIKESGLIIEAFDKYKVSSVLKGSPLTYVETSKRQNRLEREKKKIILYIDSLDKQIKVDISTKRSIDNNINKNLPLQGHNYKLLLDLIEITTFLNQNSRKYYIVENQEEKFEEKVFISEIEDVKWCFDIIKDSFIKNHFDLPERYLELLNYIIGWLAQDPVIKELKINKKVPENKDDYFVGIELIDDYIRFLEFHPEKKNFVRVKRRFREYLLHLSDHKTKGKFKCLHFIQEGNKNKFRLVSAPLLKSFNFENEDIEFYEEYHNFLQYLEENRYNVSINLNLKT